MKKNKNNKAAENAMMKYVYELLISGLPNVKIYEILGSEPYNYTINNAKRLVYKCLKNLLPDTEEDIETLKAKYVDMYLDIYQKSVNANNFRTANQILANLVKLHGLETQKIEHKIENYEVTF